ncbi:MAG TPA: hypothetical protein VF755_24250 [Catenuloplanes sp.]|jgi:hypothetical protein
MGQAPEPGRRRRWWPALAGVLALGLLVAVCAAPVGRGIRAWTVGRGSPASAQPAPSPRPGDPPQVAQRWLADQITTRLVAQSAALLGGDQDGFLAPARAAAVRTALKSRYAALRALRVAVWRPELVGLPVRTGGDNRWRTPVRFHHCFVTPDCRATSVLIDLEWAEAATGPEIVTFGASPATGQGPRPWEDGELVAAAGKRTLVATIPAQRDRLPQLLAWAEAAAAVADRYVVTGPPPERYVVFLAGRAQWKRWYGGGLPPWTSGYAVPLPQGLFEVVLNPDQLTGGTMPEVLRHELAHVSSLPDGGYDDAGNWWLAEGLADVAGADGRSVSGYPGLPDVQGQFKAGWDGRFEVTEPDAKTPDWQVSARYGIAYLAVRHLNDRFGQRDLLTFFRRVVHERRSPDSVSLEVFGQPWERVRADCAAYVRAAAD